MFYIYWVAHSANMQSIGVSGKNAIGKNVIGKIAIGRNTIGKNARK